MRIYVVYSYYINKYTTQTGNLQADFAPLTAFRGAPPDARTGVFKIIDRMIKIYSISKKPLFYAFEFYTILNCNTMLFCCLSNAEIGR